MKPYQKKTAGYSCCLFLCKSLLKFKTEMHFPLFFHQAVNQTVINQGRKTLFEMSLNYKLQALCLYFVEVLVNITAKYINK